MSHDKNFRLIWFQHFHKAAGTSIINVAKKNNETFYPKHENGNPISKDGKLLELWNYSKSELTAFVDHCETNNITFICTEWGVPLLEALADDTRVVLITCIRDPYRRLRSNYLYDLLNGYSKARSIDEYTKQPNSYCLPNYYTRELLRASINADINENMLALAKRKIDLFDCCLVLEKGLDELNLLFGWNGIEKQSNKSTKIDLRELKRLVFSKKWSAIFARIIPGYISYPDKGYINNFNALNNADNQLYEYAKKSRG